MNMTCSSDGLPAPKILWSRLLSNGDLQPLSENTTLTLTSTKMEDSGIYVCEGINQVGISRKEVELIIQGELSDSVSYDCLSYFGCVTGFEQSPF